MKTHIEHYLVENTSVKWQHVLFWICLRKCEEADQYHSGLFARTFVCKSGNIYIYCAKCHINALVHFVLYDPTHHHFEDKHISVLSKLDKQIVTHIPLSQIVCSHITYTMLLLLQFGYVKKV